eukprot:460992-Alexandrium_andersonii.AAC.1
MPLQRRRRRGGGCKRGRRPCWGRRRAPSRRGCRRTGGSGRSGRQCLRAPRRATPRPRSGARQRGREEKEE